MANGLTITKTSSSPTFSVGEIITYTIQISNTSDINLSGVRIIDDLGGMKTAYVVGSGKLTYGSNTYPVWPIATSPLTFTLQELGSGESMTLEYKCQVIFNLPSYINSITNTVQGIGYLTGTITGSASSTITRA